MSTLAKRPTRVSPLTVHFCRKKDKQSLDKTNNNGPVAEGIANLGSYFLKGLGHLPDGSFIHWAHARYNSSM